MLDDSRIGLHGFKLGCCIQLRGFFDETYRDCLPKKVSNKNLRLNLNTHFFILPPFNLCDFGNFDDHLGVTGASQG